MSIKNNTAFDLEARRLYNTRFPKAQATALDRYLYTNPPTLAQIDGASRMSLLRLAGLSDEVDNSLDLIYIHSSGWDWQVYATPEAMLAAKTVTPWSGKPQAENSLEYFPEQGEDIEDLLNEARRQALVFGRVLLPLFQWARRG